jgi:hypothetical protein
MKVCNVECLPSDRIGHVPQHESMYKLQKKGGGLRFPILQASYKFGSASVPGPGK